MLDFVLGSLTSEKDVIIFFDPGGSHANLICAVTQFLMNMLKAFGSLGIFQANGSSSSFPFDPGGYILHDQINNIIKLLECCAFVYIPAANLFGADLYFKLVDMIQFFSSLILNLEDKVYFEGKVIDMNPWTQAQVKTHGTGPMMQKAWMVGRLLVSLFGIV